MAGNKQVKKENESGSTDTENGEMHGTPANTLYYERLFSRRTARILSETGSWISFWLYPSPPRLEQRPDSLRSTMVLAKPKLVCDADACNRHLVAVLTALCALSQAVTCLRKCSESDLPLTAELDRVREELARTHICQACH